MTEEQLAALEALFGAAQTQTQGVSAAQQDILNQILAGEQGQSVHNVPEPNRAPAIMDALGHGVANGATLGFADNLLGGLAAVTGRSPDGSGFGDYSDPGASYAAMRDLARGDMARDREREPGAALTGNLVGATATSAAAAPNLAGRTLWGTLRGLAGWGAVEGAATGAGYSDAATSGDLGRASVQGGLLGALVAPGAAAATAAVTGPLKSGLLNMAGRANESLAARRLAGLLDRAGMTERDLTATMRSALADGQDMFAVADALGYSGQRALAGVARQPGEGRQAVVDWLNGRQIDQGDRVAGYVEDALGVHETASQANARLTGVRNTEANGLWGAAREQSGPVDVRDAVAAIDTRLGPMQDSGVALSPFDRTLQGYRNRLTAKTPPEGTTAVDLSDFTRVHEIRRDLADDIEAARRAGRNNEAMTLSGIRDRLDAAMEGASEPYRVANDTYAARSRVIDAVEQGQGAPRQRTQDAIDTFRGLPPAQQGPVAPGALPLQDAPQAFRTGYADTRLGGIERATPGRNAALPFTSSRDRGIMDALAYDPQQFRRQIDREMTMSQTRQQAIGGSQTADNLADQQDVNGAFEGAAVLVDALRGRFGLQGAMTIAQRLAQAGTGMNEATRNALAQALMSTDPRAALVPLLRQAQVSEGQSRAAQAFIRSLGYAQTQGRGLLAQ